MVKPGASLYLCHHRPGSGSSRTHSSSLGFEVRCQIIWAKNTFAWGFGRYKFRHEPIFYAHVAGQKDPWYGDKSQSTLWEENKPAANRIHPTAKPVELIERALVNSSKAGDIVVDLFGGSGSTLIACERRNRKSRLMEIDPKYCGLHHSAVSGIHRQTGCAPRRRAIVRRQLRKSGGRRLRESSAATARSRRSRRNFSPGIQTWKVSASRSPIGPRSCACFKTRKAAERKPGGAKDAAMAIFKT